MSKVKYAIRNGNNFVGLVWETKMGQIITTEGKEIDLEQGLSIYDSNTGEVVKNLDLLEFLFESLRFTENSEEIYHKEYKHLFEENK